MLTDFMCRCNSTSLAEAEETYQWAIKYLDTTPKNLVTDAVYKLVTEFNVGEIKIAADQWARIDTETTSVQCDHIEDGFACTLQLYVEAAA